MIDLTTQHNAAIGFSAWLSEQPNNELNASLQNVLRTYRAELQRQIAKEPASDEWFVALTMAAMEARLTIDGLLEFNPALKHYVPYDEPQNIEDMKCRLLTDAITLFDNACEGLKIHFEMPDLASEINQSIQRVLTASQ